MHSISLLLLLLAPGLASAQPGSAPERLVIAVMDSSGSLLAAGAESAVREADAEGGIAGRPLRLRRVETGDPWRDGAAAAARLLASEKGILALLAPQEGAASHVAVQAATRLRIPVLSVSPEQSLTQAKDPWVFRVVPDDAEQAAALLRWAFPDPRGRSAELVVPEGREGRERLRSLRKACRGLGVREAAAPPADAVLLWLDVSAALAWLGRPGVAASRRVLASIRLDDRDFLSRVPPAAAGLAVPLLREDSSPAGLAEALGRDMVRSVVAAARAEGAAPGPVRRGLSRGSGPFRFDAAGNRAAPRLEVGVLRAGPGPTASLVRTPPSGAPR